MQHNQYYYTCYYRQDSSSYEAKVKAIHAKAEEVLVWVERGIVKLVEKLNLNDYDLAWELYGENGKKTKEEAWEHLVARAAENRMYEKYTGILQQWVDNQKTSRKLARQIAKDYKLSVPPRFPDESREAVGDFVDEAYCAPFCNITVATLRHAISSDDALFAFIAKFEPSYNKSKEDIWAEYVQIAQRNKESLERNPATPEGIIKLDREKVKAELAALQRKVEKVKADRDEQLAYQLRMHQRTLEEEKACHDRFLHKLVEVLNVLKTPKGKIEATPTIIQTQQTYADRANMVANELTHLEPGHARVRIPTGEYLIKIIMPQTSQRDFVAKRQQIIEQTRQNYCKKRSEVEEEIRKRQDGGDDTPPSTTRKHPV